MNARFYLAVSRNEDKGFLNFESYVVEFKEGLIVITECCLSDVYYSHLGWLHYLSCFFYQGLVECIGGKTLSGILGRYAKDPRHTRSGFPDLTLWNTETKHFKVIQKTCVRWPRNFV